MNDDWHGERRQPPAPPWRRFHRRGDIWKNPIIIGVAIVLLSNVLWAAGIYAWQQGIDATHEYYRRYGAGLVSKAQHVNDPEQLRELIQRVQNARSP